MTLLGRFVGRFVESPARGLGAGFRGPSPAYRVRPQRSWCYWVCPLVLQALSFEHDLEATGDDVKIEGDELA